MTNWFKIMLAFGILGSLSLVSCNTVAGFGEDLQSAGDSIEGAGERDW
jgi:predicted small secreted protein